MPHRWGHKTLKNGDIMKKILFLALLCLSGLSFIQAAEPAQPENKLSTLEIIKRWLGISQPKPISRKYKEESFLRGKGQEKPLARAPIN